MVLLIQFISSSALTVPQGMGQVTRTRSNAAIIKLMNALTKRAFAINNTIPKYGYLLCEDRVSCFSVLGSSLGSGQYRGDQQIGIRFMPIASKAGVREKLVKSIQSHLSGREGASPVRMVRSCEG